MDRSLGTLPSVRYPSANRVVVLTFVAGGSTIVCVFEKNAVEWDDDLLVNGRASLETLVRVGMGIGRKRGLPDPLLNVDAP